MSDAEEKKNWVRMGLVADSGDARPDTVAGVVILDDHYFVSCAGLNGYLVAIRKIDFDNCISNLMHIGYDSYHV